MRWDDIIPGDAQHTGCESHILHPDLVPWQIVESPRDWVAKYRIGKKEVLNGLPAADVFGSKELLANTAACVDADPFLMDLRKEWDGRVC